MKNTLHLFRFALPSLLALAAGAFPVSSASAQGIPTLTVLHRFTGDDGKQPYTGLTLGTDGNLYGTTPYGSSVANAGGTIFKIAPDGTFTTIHSAAETASTPAPDGSFYRGELLQAPDGNFYGTAQSGGPMTTNSGTIFKMTPAGDVTSLFVFGQNDMGNNPSGALVRGNDGNFYGTTRSSYNPGNTTVIYMGTIFKITPEGVLTTLHRFVRGENNGDTPEGTLCLGSDGNFYGTTADTDSGDPIASQTLGTVFKITPDGVFTTLHRFALDGRGNTPVAGLVEGPDGYFYGTTSDQYSSSQLGTVFKISRDGDFTMLHQFVAGSDGGGISFGELIKGQDGKLYGTTIGARGSVGSVYSITTDGQLTTLYAFPGSGASGAAPVGRLLQASDGSFYGTTYTGGVNNFGNVFHLTFSTHPAFFTGETALSNGVYYLQFAGTGTAFGYYSYLSDPHYIYHFDLGYEYVFDAADNKSGVYLYDFKSGGFFYTSPSFPFPYLYDFTLNSTLYYYPDPNNPGRYNTDGVRYFYEFANGQIISK